VTFNHGVAGSNPAGLTNKFTFFGECASRRCALGSAGKANEPWMNRLDPESWKGPASPVASWQALVVGASAIVAALPRLQ
jgi:hypothetical protein